jgi:hypothetical protein
MESVSGGWLSAVEHFRVTDRIEHRLVLPAARFGLRPAVRRPVWELVGGDVAEALAGITEDQDPSHGAPTPSIDRIAAEGVRLTDCYAQGSSRPGRAALSTC